MVWIIDNLIEVIALFAQVATNDPASPLLLLSAAGILVFALGTFGVLAIGGVLSALAGS
ncbi:hypothetical protein [Halanaeroarchaeum sulfurireducens]|uniref:Uncharacterized protein n=1 Tax=Halanaeroarchaeum sulfurireducens TaxID=1604004 RepID=A0A0F7PC32_9EURY|nr:hypothetical protein [Halanaeroarchaeum sulfurireducens]AKH96923.1 hypothetical protein HLASF_0417 [Halanaeroarchaeum sulfurireducens]ALG81325.1 hypothetical protein HLASA_0416 [Halanaeroarchaeum sulfurireducens]